MKKKKQRRGCRVKHASSTCIYPIKQPIEKESESAVPGGSLQNAVTHFGALSRDDSNISSRISLTFKIFC